MNHFRTEIAYGERGFRIYLIDPHDETLTAEAWVALHDRIAPDAATLELIEVNETPFKGHGIGTKLYDMAIDLAAAQGLRLLPSPDLSADGFVFWARKNPAALTEVLTHPDIERIAEYWGADPDKLDEHITEIAARLVRLNPRPGLQKTKH